MAQKDISSDLKEKREFPPSAAFRKQANIKAAQLQSMYDKAAEDYVGFWADLAVANIEWHRPFTVPLDDVRAPNYRWFTDGELNVSYNCLDVHLAERADNNRIHCPKWEWNFHDWSALTTRFRAALEQPAPREARFKIDLGAMLNQAR